MKNKYYILVILLFVFKTANTFGQIPNSGFENWTSMGSYLNPDGWWTTNDSIMTGSFFPVTKSTDHYPASVGSYSIRLENNMALLPSWGALGITWTGNINGGNNPVFPVIGHPISLWGYYKFFPQNNDSMDVHIRLYKNGVDISGGNYKTAVAAPSWTPFSMNFTTYVDADSARIFISTCYDNDAPIAHGNSVLYIDNLNFDSLIVAGISNLFGEENKISIYPNPASEKLIINYAGNIGKQISCQIFNALGQNVFTQNISNDMRTSELDISQFSEGLYFIRLTTEQRKVYDKKIIITK